MSALRHRGPLLALALLLALVGAVAAGAIAFGKRIADGVSQIDDRLERIARFERLALDAAGLEKAIADLGTSGRWAELLVDAPSDRVATADLQQLLKSIVAGTGGSLTSARVLEPESIEGFRKVGLEVRASLATRGLRDTLHRLESGPPMLLVESLVVVSRRAPRRRANRLAGQTLDVRFRRPRAACERPGWVREAPDPTPAVDIGAAPSALAGLEREGPGAVPTLPELESLSDTVERPLFRPDRRPAPAGQAAAPTTATSATPPRKILTGVVIVADEPVALLRGDDPSQTQRARVGGLGERLFDLAPERVVVPRRTAALAEVALPRGLLQLGVRVHEGPHAPQERAAQHQEIV